MAGGHSGTLSTSSSRATVAPIAPCYHSRGLGCALRQLLNRHAPQPDDYYTVHNDVLIPLLLSVLKVVLCQMPYWLIAVMGRVKQLLHEDEAQLRLFMSFLDQQNIPEGNQVINHACRGGLVWLEMMPQ